MAKASAAGSSAVLQAGFEAKPGDAMAAPAYGTAPAGVTCENGICYPNGSTTTAAPAGYQQPATATGSYGTNEHSTSDQ